MLILYSWWVISTGHVIVSGKLYGDIYELRTLPKHMIGSSLILAAAFVLAVPFNRGKMRWVVSASFYLAILLFTIGFFSR